MIRFRSFLLVLSVSFTFAWPLLSTSANSTPGEKPRKEWISTGAGTYVSTPTDFTPPPPVDREFHTDHFTVKLYARAFSAGEAVYMEVLPGTRKTNLRQVSFKVNGKEVLLSKRSWGYRGFFGLHPDFSGGQVNIEYDIHTEGKQVNGAFVLKLQPKKFPVSTTPMNVGKYSDKSEANRKDTIDFINRSRKKKEAVFARRSSNAIGNKWSHPRNYHYITSEFWAKRVYARYEIVNGQKKKLQPKVSIHRGLDFRARPGEPVYAMADGKVVLAEELYYEGNCVFIDHGNGIISSYFHLSDIRVGKFQRVYAGQLIGLGGSTGVATAAHLHVAFYINGTPVDPLSLLSLPVRY